MTFLLRAQRDKEEIIFSFSAPKREKSLIRFLEIRGRLGYNTLNIMFVCFLTGETSRHMSRHRETFASRKMTSLSRGEDEEERKTRVANALPKTWLEKTALSVSDDAFSKRLFVRCYASHLEIENNENVRDWMYALTETNMREMYEQTWGWNSLEKRRELSDQNAKFVLVFTREMKRGEEGKEAKVALNTDGRRRRRRKTGGVRALSIRGGRRRCRVGVHIRVTGGANDETVRVRKGVDASVRKDRMRFRIETRGVDGVENEPSCEELLREDWVRGNRSRAGGCALRDHAETNLVIIFSFSFSFSFSNY